MSSIKYEKKDICPTVKKIMVDKLGLKESLLTDNASFGDDLGIDSLDVFEMQMTLENTFGIRFTEEETERMTTVGAAISCISNKLQHQSALISILEKPCQNDRLINTPEMSQ